MNVINYKCPSCGAPLRFKSENQKMGCDSCGNSFSLNDIKQYDKVGEMNSNISGWSGDEYKGMQAYVCPSCGAEIIADETTAATSCPYCDNTTVLPKQFDGEFRPDFIIPFKINKQKAIETLKLHYKGKRFLPKSFTLENKIEEIKGIYVPFWLWDCDVEADITYRAEEVTRWSDGNYNYTKTDHYRLIRGGEVEFSQIPVDGSSKIDNTLMEAIEPFKYRQMKEFSTAYLSGYLAEKYDVEADDSTERIKERIRNSIEDMFESTISKEYTNVRQTDINIKSRQNSYEYALLPIWLLNTGYGRKTYTFAMNGQTGKFIGNLPVSKRKFLTWFVGLSAVFSIGGFLLALACAAGGII